MGFKFIVAVAVLLSTTASFADESAFNFLKNAAQKVRRINYYAVCVYHAEGLNGTFKLAHFRDGPDDANTVETLAWSTPAGQSLEKKQNLIIYRGSFLARLDRFIPELVKEHYDFRLGAYEQLADRQARLLYATPKDAYRYARQFWVDEKTGLVLGYRILAEKNQVIEEVRCRQLKTVTKPALKRDTVQDAREEESQKGESLGFMQKVALPRYFPGHAKPLTQLFFTDGFSSFSIFIEEKKADEQDQEIFSRFGATSKLVAVKGSYKLTAIGAVPRNTLEKTIETILANGVPPIQRSQ